MAYTYYKPLTIDHTQVGGATLTNFPVLLFATISQFKTVGNGGHIQNTDAGRPADLVFSPNQDGSSKYDFEIVAYDAATGGIEVWIRIPSLSHTTDLVIYAAYGDSGVTTYQGNDTGTWDSNYKAVYHYKDGTTLSAADSTSNAENGSITGVAAVAGQIDGGADFGGGSDKITTSAFSVYSNPMTFEWWEKGSDQGDSSYQVIAGAAGFAFLLYHHAASVETGGVQAITLFSAGGERGVQFVPDGNWHHWMFVVDSGGALAAYKDGVSQTIQTVTAGTMNPATTAALEIGNSGIPLVAHLDELRFSDTDRPGGWATASYNNQKSGQTFLTVGAEFQPITVTPGTGQVIVTGLAPTFSTSDNKAVTPGVGQVLAIGLAPTFVTSDNQTVTPGVGQLIATGFEPIAVISDNQIVTPDLGQVIITGFAPTVVTEVIVTPGVGSLTLAGFSPTVEVTLNTVARPDVGQVIISGFAPIATGTVAEDPAISFGGQFYPRG